MASQRFVSQQRYTFSPLSLAVLFTLSTMLLATHTAEGQSLCVSPAYGVPGLPGAPLWVTNPPKVTKTELDDPRWAGASRLYFPPDTGTSLTDGSVRLVVEGSVLHLSYQTNVDPSVATADTIWLGIGKNATNAGSAAGDDDLFLAEISLGGGAVTSANTGVTISAWKNQTNTPAGWSIDLSPSWVVDEAYWVGSAMDNYKWAVNVKFDLSAVGVTPTSDGRLFVASFVETGLSSGWIHQWPTDAVFIADPANPVSNFDQTVVDPTNWGTLTLATYSSPCTDGISLSWAQIGAAPPPDNIINTLSAGSDHTDNDYFATPSWNSFTPGANVIKARFRIANWGSVADPAAPWTEIAANVMSDASGEIHFNCPAGTAVCGALPVGADDHQCVLVELEKGSAPTLDPLKFERDSVYRNMDYDISSKLERTAEINIKGLKPLAASTHRDTYLYVRTINMAPPSGEEMFLPKEQMQRAARMAKNPPRRPMARPKKPGDGQQPGVAAEAAAAVAPAKRRVPPPLDPDLAKDSFEHMTESWPTYEVHVYHDTGKHVIVRGKKYRLLKPQVPFGYFVDHNGAFYGFEHSIQGVDGAKLEELSKDFYRLTIENDKFAKVKTTIIAREEPPAETKPCCPKAPPVQVVIKPRCYCNAPGSGGNGLFALPLALGLVLMAAKRRRTRRQPRS